MNVFSLDDSVGYTINIIANLLKRELNDEFKREGVEVMAEQWALLLRLQERAGMNQLELAQATSRDNASITRSLVVLEKKQLIERQQVDQDRRDKYLALTPAGQALVPRMVACAQQVLERATQGMTTEEVTLFNQIIRKMIGNLS
ncbi:MarR family winged helix-turn-helix transcriptional regulator [Spirosoma fluviale]|uniref:Transcriptional regulator, MarR family n=1 Tax=Spirosoma fluviale TaxID=1597977 RepID=A0A286GQC7_9BACT|nr:MarR family transcriptional regulator [Spirosoma fluviale]SOD97702.1 transcriptional regulator, MarR family [Spirosoma fluviale]